MRAGQMVAQPLAERVECCSHLGLNSERNRVRTIRNVIDSGKMSSNAHVENVENMRIIEPQKGSTPVLSFQIGSKLRVNCGAMGQCLRCELMELRKIWLHNQLLNQRQEEAALH